MSGAQAFGGLGAREPGLLLTTLKSHSQSHIDPPGQMEACCEPILSMYFRRGRDVRLQACSRSKIASNDAYQGILVVIVCTANPGYDQGRLSLALMTMHGWRLQELAF